MSSACTHAIVSGALSLSILHVRPDQQLQLFIDRDSREIFKNKIK